MEENAEQLEIAWLHLSCGPGALDITTSLYVTEFISPLDVILTAQCWKRYQHCNPTKHPGLVLNVTKSTPKIETKTFPHEAWGQRDLYRQIKSCVYAVVFI